MLNCKIPSLLYTLLHMQLQKNLVLNTLMLFNTSGCPSNIFQNHKLQYVHTLRIMVGHPCDIEKLL